MRPSEEEHRAKEMKRATDQAAAHLLHVVGVHHAQIFSPSCALHANEPIIRSLSGSHVQVEQLEAGRCALRAAPIAANTVVQNISGVWRGVVELCRTRAGQNLP